MSRWEEVDVKNFYIFAHIPRTGGTTFRKEILDKNFKGRIMSYGNFDVVSKNEGIDCIYGHLKLGSPESSERHLASLGHGQPSWILFITPATEPPPPEGGGFTFAD